MAKERDAVRARDLPPCPSYRVRAHRRARRKRRKGEHPGRCPARPGRRSGAAFRRLAFGLSHALVREPRLDDKARRQPVRRQCRGRARKEFRRPHGDDAGDLAARGRIRRAAFAGGARQTAPPSPPEMLYRQLGADAGDDRAALAICCDTAGITRGRETGMTYGTIEIQAGQGVAVLWLNRPDVRNAFNETMIAELTAAFGELEADRAVRAVVLAGRGKVFCAGADLNWMKRMGELDFEENRKDAKAFGAMLARLHALAKPTVARVHGAAFAGGMGLIAACDIAVASVETEFSVSEARLGLTPPPVIPYVIAAMGERAAHRYFLTAERFPAAEAYRIGFVQELAQPAELDATVNAILGELVQGAPAAHAVTKDLIHTVASRRIDSELMDDMATRIATARASAEGKEGVRAFLEKRKPAWLQQAMKSGAKKKR